MPNDDRFLLDRKNGTGITLASCPVCGAAPSPWAVRTNEHGDWPIMRCPNCGFAFVNPRPDHDLTIALQDIVGEYVRQFPDSAMSDLGRIRQC